MKITVHVKPGSKKGPLIERGTDDMLLVYVRERAVDGAANEAVRALLARHFSVSKSKVVLVRGYTSRIKAYEISKY